MSEELKQLRDKIDVIDLKLLNLINQRARLSQEAGEVKKSDAIYRPEREAQILTRLQSQNPGPIENENIVQLFTEIISQCRSLERPIAVNDLRANDTFSGHDKIDIIDSELLNLVSQRAKLAQKAGKVKKSDIIYRPEREAQILTRIQSQNPGPIANENIAQLFTEVMSQCRALEKSMVVAYLGPSGTFSEEASIKRFGHAITTLACNSIDEVFNKVESGAAGYGVVPVENSTEGAIGKTMDLLLQTSSTVCGEILLPVHQFLMAQQTDLSAINKIYSHPQSFAQCHQWIRTNLPHISSADFINTSSNADASRQAAESENTAAIASKRAAEIFKLSICAENIEDDPKNTTRFLVIGTQDVETSGKDKTSLAMSTSNNAGAIYKLLAPLAEHGVSMSRLESRPSRTDLWQYVFFVDVEGHKQNENVSAALKEIAEKATFLKILGSYPAT